MGRKRTHDERLRQRLLDEASGRISKQGLGGLNLRTLAAAVGTSTSAVYSLFGGKSGLLAAVHERAFRRFGSAQQAVARTDDPVEDVVQLGLAYRDSALDDPNGYWIMFGGDVPPSALPPDLRDAAAGTFLPLLGAVQRCVAAGRFRDDVPPESIATALWANVHGLVSLELRGFMPPTAGDPAAVYETAVRTNVAAWGIAPVTRGGRAGRPPGRGPARPRSR